MSQNQVYINAYDYNLMIQNLSTNFSAWSANDSGPDAGAATPPPWYVQDLKLISSAYNKFKSNHRSTENWLNKIDFLLLLLGVFGNMAALTTMFKRRSSMGTPSFVYHKALVAADLLFCLNFLFMKFVEQSTRHNGSKIYTTYALAFYAIFVNRALSSTCGYIVLYMSLAISFDRFVAIWYYNWYPRFNKSSVALSILLASLVLASAVNSWSIWVERVVVDLKLDPYSMLKFRQDETPEIVDPNADQYPSGGAFYETYDAAAPLASKRGASKFSTILYMAKPYSTPDLSKLIWIKNIYNMILRVAYPLALTFLTGMVILGFLMREKRRRRYEIEKVNRATQNYYESINQLDGRKASGMYNYSNNGNINNNNNNNNNTITNGKRVACSSTATSSSGVELRLNNGSIVAGPSSTTAVLGRFSTSRRRDRALYYLMVAVVILVFCQVIPREAKRLFELIYPVDYTMACMEDKSDGRTVHERLFCFHLFAYGHLFTKLLLNTLTAANRSLVFYVYFALNRCFRKAVLQTFGFERRTSLSSSRRRRSQGRRRSSAAAAATAVHRRVWNNVGLEEPMMNGGASTTLSPPREVSRSMVSSGL